MARIQKTAYASILETQPGAPTYANLADSVAAARRGLQSRKLFPHLMASRIIPSQARGFHHRYWFCF